MRAASPLPQYPTIDRKPDAASAYFTLGRATASYLRQSRIVYESGSPIPI